MLYKNLIKLYNTIVDLQKLKGSKWKFNFLLIEIKKKTTEETTKTNEELKTLQQSYVDAKLNYCEKKNGKAIVFYSATGAIRHKGLALGECPEYDTEVKELDAEVNKINNREIDIDLSDIKKVKKEVCPQSEMTGDHWEILSDWIEDFHS